MLSRFGRYDLVRPLGRGGMAEVFLACQRGPAGYEKKLVIKRILPERARDPALLRRFFEEARLHAGLSHGNLVPIFDFGRVGNEYFLALELVDGCDLGRLLEALHDHVLAPELCAYIGAELCHALVHVHRQGLVHRDITPRNVLLSRDGEVKLADFGVAVGTAGPVATAGTQGFMAPEQARGDAVDARADQYALGAVLAKALGTHGDTGLREIVERAMAGSPEARFPDASDMAEALEARSAHFATPRSAAARSLAKLVRAHAPDLTTGRSDAPVPTPRGPATYYRDDTTAASIVDEILTPRPPVARRFVLPTVALIATGVGLFAALHRGAATQPREDRSVTTPVPVAPPPAPTPTPPEPTVVPAPAPHLVTTYGALEVVCEPWCIVSVDGTKRGEDGRLHRLRLPVGSHRITATRLEDRQTRAIPVSETAQTVRFAFE